jgi:hypothetical protein
MVQFSHGAQPQQSGGVLTASWLTAAQPRHALFEHEKGGTRSLARGAQPAAGEGGRSKAHGRVADPGKETEWAEPR